MNRAAALKLIGTRVRVWTAMNGIYVGTLEEVSGSPWRGAVRITSVIEPACAWSTDRIRPRRGFRPGDLIKAGGVNITSTEETGTSYLDAMQLCLEIYQGYLSSLTIRQQDKWWLTPTINALTRLIEQESAGGEPATDAQGAAAAAQQCESGAPREGITI